MTDVLMVANWDWVLAHFNFALAKRLRDEGYSVSFVCPPGNYVGKLHEARFRWIPWRLERRNMGPLGELRSAWRLVQLVQQEQPDVVHAITIKPVVYLSVITRWRSLVHRHARPEVLINNLTGLGYLFSDAWRARMALWLLWPLLVVCLRQRRVYTVVLNDGDRQRLQSLRVLSIRRTYLISGAGVNIEWFTPTLADGSNSGDPRRVRVLFAARLLSSKGLVEFVEAARQLRREGTEVEFLVAGNPDPGNPETISAERIKGWHEEGTVTWLGHVPAMSELLPTVDVVVLPSHSEGLPRILQEGAAAGCGLVASDIDGCREVVEHGRNGLLVPPGDIEALTAAIRALGDDPEHRHALGAEARRVAVERFDLQLINDQWLNLYQELIGEGSTPAS